MYSDILRYRVTVILGERRSEFPYASLELVGRVAVQIAAFSRLLTQQHGYRRMPSSAVLQIARRIRGHELLAPGAEAPGTRSSSRSACRTRHGLRFLASPRPKRSLVRCPRTRSFDDPASFCQPNGDDIDRRTPRRRTRLATSGQGDLRTHADNACCLNNSNTAISHADKVDSCRPC